jgi:hyperosmotically inducible protein
MFKFVTRAGIALLFTLGAAHLSAESIQQTADAKLKDRIEHRLETNKNVRKYDIKVKVEAGKATLTGDVATVAQKTEAGTVAKIEGVSLVTNSITVNPDADRTLAERTKSGLNKLGEKITDAWITTKVKWFLTGDDALEGSSINVDTANNVVTLKGTVKTQAGKARAVALAKDVDGVKSVVDQLTIAK